MTKPTKNELWELAAVLSEADSEDHEDDEAIQPTFDLLQKLSNRQQEIVFDLLQPHGRDEFKKVLKQVCTSNLSYEQLEHLGIEDILIDRTDPAGIVYKIVVASWEGEGGL